MSFHVLKSFGLAATLLSMLLASSVSYAVPVIQDHWRFLCVPKGVSNKSLSAARNRAGGGGDALSQAIAAFNYACVQSAVELKQHEARMQKFIAGGSKGNPPQVDTRTSLSLLRTASQQLTEVAKRKKDDPKALYFHGFALALLGDEWAVNKFDDVITGSADSPYAADSMLAMAEFLYEKKGLAAAMPKYKQALKSKKPSVQLYTRYKLAWVDYLGGAQAKNRQVQKRAMTAMARLSKDLGELKGNDAALNRLVKEDILAFVVDFGDQAEAQNILKSVGATDVYATFLERAAYTKMEAGDSAGAYKLFGAAIKEQPTNKANVDFTVNQIALAARMNNVPLVVSNLKFAVSNYVGEKSKWRKKQKAADLKKTDTQIEGTLLEYAAGVDQQGRGANKPDMLNAAEGLYTLFEKSFPKSDKLYEVKFSHGQLLYILQKFPEAAQAMMALINGNMKGSHTKDASDIMVAAAQAMVDADKTKYGVPKAGSIKKKIKIPAVKKTYADCLELFLKLQPKNENAILIKAQVASIYYDFGHYKEGNKRYMSFITAHPAHELAKPAVVRIFEYYKQQKSDEAYEKIKAKIAAIKPVGAAPELQPYFAEKKVAKEDEKGKKGKKKKKKKKSGDDEEPAEDAEGSGEDEESVASGDGEGDVEEASEQQSEE